MVLFFVFSTEAVEKISIELVEQLSYLNQSSLNASISIFLIIYISFSK